MKSSEVRRLERYMTFHLAEILDELGSIHEPDSDADPTWCARWGSSANVVKESLLRARDDINWAFARIREGTYGNCVGCGNEIELRKLEAVPWSKLCVVCQEESDQHQQVENRFLEL